MHTRCRTDVTASQHSFAGGSRLVTCGSAICKVPAAALYQFVVHPCLPTLQAHIRERVEAMAMLLRLLS